MESQISIFKNKLNPSGNRFDWLQTSVNLRSNLQGSDICCHAITNVLVSAVVVPQLYVMVLCFAVEGYNILSN